MIPISAPSEETQVRKVYVPSRQLGIYFKTEEDRSLANIVADKSTDEIEFLLSRSNGEDILYDRNFWLRPSQLAAVNSTKQLTVCLAGRG